MYIFIAATVTFCVSIIVIVCILRMMGDVCHKYKPGVEGTNSYKRKRLKETRVKIKEVNEEDAFGSAQHEYWRQ